MVECSFTNQVVLGSGPVAVTIILAFSFTIKSQKEVVNSPRSQTLDAFSEPCQRSRTELAAVNYYR